MGQSRWVATHWPDVTRARRDAPEAFCKYDALELLEPADAQATQTRTQRIMLLFSSIDRFFVCVLFAPTQQYTEQYPLAQGGAVSHYIMPDFSHELENYSAC